MNDRPIAVALTKLLMLRIADKILSVKSYDVVIVGGDDRRA